MRDLVVTLIVFGVLPFVLYRPQVGVLAWSWIGYMNPHRLGWGFAYNFPFAAVIAAFTIVSLLFSRQPKKLPWNSLTAILLLFVVWMTISSVFSLYPETTWGQWEKVMKIQLMIFITLICMTDRKSLDGLVWIIVLSLGFYGVKGGIFTAMTGGQYMVLGPPGTFIGGNTTLALALIMIIPLMRYLQLQAEKRWLRWGLGFAMLLTAIAIIGSYSRGALLAGGGIALYLILKTRKKLLIGAVVAITIPFALALMPDQWFEKMDTISTYEEDESAMGRINAWWFAFNLAKDHPLTGGGFNTFKPVLFLQYAPDPEDFHDAHSIYFEVLAEHGFVGLGLFLVLGLLAWRNAGQVVRQCRDRTDLYWARDLAAMIQVSMLGYYIGGAFLGLAYFDLIYHLIAIVILLQVIVQREAEAADAANLSALPGHPPSGFVAKKGFPQ